MNSLSDFMYVCIYVIYENVYVMCVVLLFVKGLDFMFKNNLKGIVIRIRFYYRINFLIFYFFLVFVKNRYFICSCL